MQANDQNSAFFCRLTVGCFIAILMILATIQALAQTRVPETALSPFQQHEERYQILFRNLVEKGVEPDRIMAILSSDKAKKVDMTPVERMSERVIPLFQTRTKAQIDAIARQLVDHIGQYKAHYDELEERFGVNREIAAAILFKETALGKFNNWQHYAFPALNTIVGFMDLPKDPLKRKRAQRIIDTARKSLEGLIFYCERYGIDILAQDFPSSFAGAIGIPQFMPMHMIYAVSPDKGVPDLSRMHDAILSLGNIFKKKFGWPGLMDLDRLAQIDDIILKYKDFDQQKGVSFCASEHLDGYPLRRFVDEFKQIPHIDYIGEHCQTIMQYNFSSAYVLDVFQFAYHANQRVKQRG